MAPSGHMAMITAGQSSHSPHVADRLGTCEEQAGRPAGRRAGEWDKEWGRGRSRSRRVVRISLTDNLPLVLILTFPSPSRASKGNLQPGAI